MPTFEELLNYSTSTMPIEAQKLVSNRDPLMAAESISNNNLNADVLNAAAGNDVGLNGQTSHLYNYYSSGNQLLRQRLLRQRQQQRSRLLQQRMALAGAR